MNYMIVEFVMFVENNKKSYSIPINNGTLYKLSKAGLDVFKIVSGEQIAYHTVVDGLAALLEDQGVIKEQLLEQPPIVTNHIIECFMSLITAYQEDMNEGGCRRSGWTGRGKLTGSDKAGADRRGGKGGGLGTFGRRYPLSRRAIRSAYSCGGDGAEQKKQRGKKARLVHRERKNGGKINE